jgi:hypothetical protein
MNADVLCGAIDAHVHSFPDVIKRKLDDLELVEQARQAGMRAVVLKSHIFSTSERAYLLNQLYPDFRVFGGIVLNETVGGFNPHAVEAALKMGCVQVWMPTRSAANHQHHLGGRGRLTIFDGAKLGEDVVCILRLVADTDAILATGHLSPEESRRLIEEALALGVRRISVTHPEWGVTAMPLELQKHFAATGSIFFERCLVSTQPDLPQGVPFEAIVKQIRAVGASSTIIATDFGMPQYPTPVEGMRDYLERLMQSGFSGSELKLMVQVNPARLLKLE